MRRLRLITGLVIVAGGGVTAAVADPGSSLLQLLLLGIVGPELLYSIAQSRIHNRKDKDKGAYLGGEPGRLGDFLGA